MGIIILKIVYEKNEKKSTKHFVIFVQTKSFVCIEVAQVMSVNCIKFAFKTCKNRRIDENEEKEVEKSYNKGVYLMQAVAQTKRNKERKAMQKGTRTHFVNNLRRRNK